MNYDSVRAVAVYYANTSTVGTCECEAPSLESPGNSPCIYCATEALAERYLDAFPSDFYDPLTLEVLSKKFENNTVELHPQFTSFQTDVEGGKRVSCVERKEGWRISVLDKEYPSLLCSVNTVGGLYAAMRLANVSVPLPADEVTATRDKTLPNLLFCNYNAKDGLSPHSKVDEKVLNWFGFKRQTRRWKQMIYELDLGKEVFLQTDLITWWVQDANGDEEIFPTMFQPATARELQNLIDLLRDRYKIRMCHQSPIISRIFEVADGRNS